MTLITDIHIHAHNLIPQPFRLIYKIINRNTMPSPFYLQEITQTDLAFVVVNAVGDKIVTGLYGFNAYQAVKRQIKKIRRETKKIEAIIYKNSDSINEALQLKRPLVMIAVEGGDFLSNRIERIKEIHEMGVRALTIVHSADNCIGFSTLSLAELLKKSDTLPQKKFGGLTEFGKKVIEQLNQHDIIIDLSHSCEETANDALEHSVKPVIASHTGALAVQPKFPRYLSDDLIQGIAQKGGIIGLWPFFLNNYGTKTRNDLMNHAKYLKSLIGASHLAIGTDINGLPGIMEDFQYPSDLDSLEKDFKKINFSEDEIKGVLGENFISFLKKNKF